MHQKVIKFHCPPRFHKYHLADSKSQNCSQPSSRQISFQAEKPKIFSELIIV